MKWKEFRKTERFKLADMIDVIDEDGFDFIGTHNQLQNKEIIDVRDDEYQTGALIVTIRR